MHNATDEKFINAANTIFENAFPGQNLFIILKPPANPPLRYVELRYNTKIIIRNKRIKYSLSELLKTHDIIILHGLNAITASLVNKETIPKIVYLPWGAEISLNHENYQNQLYGNKTLILKKRLRRKLNIGKLKSLYHLIKNFGTKGTSNKVLPSIFGIRFIGISFIEEFEKQKNSKVFHSDSHFIPFTYYPLESIIKDFEKSHVTGNNILVGNSSSYTNNHLETFDLLKGIELEQRKIIVPLGYGSKIYSRSLIRTGKRLFKNNFMPIETFKSLKEYTEILCSCNIVLMNHLRQEAYGTILSVMWLGAKVFLNESNTIFLYLKRIGCHVYALNKISHSNHNDLLVPLSDLQIQENRNIIQKEISLSVIVNKLKHGMNVLFPNLPKN